MPPPGLRDIYIWKVKGIDLQMKSKGSETAVISQSNTVDPSTITA